DDEHRCLRSFSASLQQAIEGSEVDLYREVRRSIGSILQECATLMDGFCPELPETFLVNGAGNFAVGGPEGDNGLSGKKLVVDGYGPRVSIGGGALSGKDFFKADRAGAILARRIAKAVAATAARNAPQPWRSCRARTAFPSFHWLTKRAGGWMRRAGCVCLICRSPAPETVTPARRPWWTSRATAISPTPPGHGSSSALTPAVHRDGHLIPSRQIGW